jgi:hypothetical protein
MSSDYTPSPDHLTALLATGLFGSLVGQEDEFLTFERTPLLLSKKEDSSARAGAAVWLDQPPGWFATNNSDIDALSAWIPNLASARFFVASSQESCWKCGDISTVYCLAMPEGYLSMDVQGDPNGEDEEAVVESVLADSGTFISNLTLVNGSVRRLLREKCPSYHLDFSQTNEGHYFMNHCGHCGAKFGDFYMHDEPDGAFFPTTEEEAKNITLQVVEATLLAQGSSSVRFPDYMPFCTVQR